jgi:PKD repeat protein
MKKLVVIVAGFIAFINIHAQTDNLFWFGAPDVSSTHGLNHPPSVLGNGAPIYLHVTAVKPTTVTISQPANPSFVPITFNLNELEHRTVRLDNIPGFDVDMIETYPQPWPIPVGNQVQKKAFKIVSSPGDITVYYELDNYWNRDIFALKGRNALGREFYVSTQNFFPNGDYGGTAWSGFVVCATENNTQITVYRNEQWLHHTSPVAPPVTPITITLNAGETFAFRAAYVAANRHINGVRVTSTKNIAVTVYDDSMQKRNSPSSTSYDIFGDQLIPVSLIGQEYLVMKGSVYMSAVDGGEKFFITATQPNTQVWIDGVLKTTLMNAGDIYTSENVTTRTVHIWCNRKVYVNHITGYGGELGGAVLPTLDGCTGSYDVTFTRTPNTGDAFYLNLMVRNDTAKSSPTKNKAVENFTITSGGSTVSIPASYFTYILDSTWAVIKDDATTKAFISNQIQPGHEALVQNPIARFHLGVVNGGSTTGCKYGYFSDYKPQIGSAGIGGAHADPVKVYCNLDPIRLVATGGIAYRWYGDSNPLDTLNLSDTRIADPIFTPDSAGIYKFMVHIKRECYADTNIYLTAYVILGPVADFVLSETNGCSPFSPLITNNTNKDRADKMLWNFDTRYNQFVNQDTLSNPFHWTFPENHTDTMQSYTISLTAYGILGSCPTTMTRTVKVRPGINAAFAPGKTAGCSPLHVTFQNLSSGHIGPNSFYWEFGDQTQSFLFNPDHVYDNYGDEDSIYTVRLIATSPLACSDTAERDITVHPYIKASLALDTAISCSPMLTELKVSNSVGVDTFKWKVDYAGTISNFKTLDYSSVPITHTDYTLVSPDTVKIDMIVQNRMGCADTFPQQKVIVIPVVNADFDVVPTVVCDSVRVLFTNLSSGYKLRYDLNFGDGVSAVDTVKRDRYHRYFNRTASDIIYTATLTTISDNQCIDTKDTSITVHPYVRANFAIDYESNCAPINVIISNLSTNADMYEWDWGDNTGIDNSGAPFLSHQYWNPLTDRDTTYILKLRVISPEGCIDSFQRSILIFPQVVAAFDMDVDEGCNPLTIAFQNNSTGKNLSYNWQFGNDLSSSIGSTLFQRTFSHYSASDSTFDVTLTAFNNYGCDSIISRPVTIYSYIDADFIVARSDSCSPFDIDIANRSPAGVTSYEWDFGDGSLKSPAFEPAHTYHNTSLVNRTDNLQLVVKNNHACYDTLIRPINVYPEINADFTVDKIQGCQPLTINFLGNSTNILTETDFYWTFGDGTFSTRQLPLPHTYTNYQNTSINRTIKMNAVSRYGCSDSIFRDITIFPYIFAKFAVDKAAVCSDEIFEIDRSATNGAINQYLWDFNNDGITDATSSTPVFNHSYSNTTLSPQNTTIKLTVTNAQGCDTSWIQSLVVYPQVQSSFEIDDLEPCYPHNSMLHNISSYKGTVATRFFWDFGDGSVSVSDDDYIGYIFHNFGNNTDKQYTVSLIAESDYECRDTTSKVITIHPKPKADFNFPVTVDCPPFPVTFTNASRGTDLDYEWDFDDSSPFSTEINPTHIFDNQSYEISEYDIELISTTEFGCSDTLIKPILIYPRVNVDFGATAWQGCSPMIIAFDGTAQNHTQVTWYIDDAAFSTLENPSYRFVNNTPSNITYDIKFKASSIYNCTDDTVKQVTIYPSPAAEFIPSPVLQDFNTETDISLVEFTNYTQHQGSGAWNYQWSYGDGTSDFNSLETFVREYTTWGDINNKNKIPVKLTAWNKDNPECRDSALHDIIINPPIPEIDVAEDIAGCAPLSVQFTSTAKYIYTGSYQWDFGYNGETDTAEAPVFLYTEPGVYIAKLTVEGDGGLNWDYKKITVHSKPIIDFTFAPEIVMEGSSIENDTMVKFFNSTLLGTEYIWDFGDGQISYEKEPAHTYEDTGRYYITLIATSIEGCIDTFANPIPVIVEGARQLDFPTAFVVSAGGAEDENYDPDDPNLRVFRPVARGVEKYRLEIYNRWGELIFVSEDVNKGWNGYVDGQLAKQDVYIWRVTATFTGGKPMIKAGDVTMLVQP